MIHALTLAEAEEIFRSQVDGKWYDDLISDPDGTALVFGMFDAFVAVDEYDADLAASLRVRSTADPIGDPASGPVYSTVPLSITRKRSGRNVTIAAGTRVQSPDAHVFYTASDVSWGAGELASKIVQATAVTPGHHGILPPGTITQFVPVANGVTGLGTNLALVTNLGLTSLRLTTNATKPHLYRKSYDNLYWEITSCPAHPTMVGRQFRISRVNDSVSPPPVFLDEEIPESRYAWTDRVVLASSAEFSGISTGAVAHEWIIRDWAELGFSVTNTDSPSLGRYGFLDELSRSRGRQRAPGEPDEVLRARMLRAPEPPTPLGVLRAAIVALAPYGVTRHNIQIYELGESGPDSIDLYAENFPAAGGFLADMHCSDMSTPVTPYGMYASDPDYGLLSPAFDPGLAFTFNEPITPFRYIVRWDPPVGMAVEAIKSARIALWNSMLKSGPPGAFFQIYNPEQWGYLAMTFDDHLPLERVDALELKLHQRFAARDHNSGIRFQGRQRLHGPNRTLLSQNRETDRKFCLGGLQVEYVSGSTVMVLPGQIIDDIASPVTETRPGTYSPAPAEPDDDAYVVSVLATATNVAPAVPIAGALASDEWWIVSVTPSLEVVESDSNRVVFNEGTGVFDAASTDKISRWVLTPVVTRGAAAATLFTVISTVPAGSVHVAWIFVPASATDLSVSLFFDVRKLFDQSPGPNMVGGYGQFGYLDTATSGLAPMVAPSSSTTTFSGQFFARYRGQILRASMAFDGGVSARDIKDPNATWNAGASTATPKIAWLYLATVGGYVPRLTANGASTIGNGAATNENTYFDGCIVLSSVEPVVGVPAVGASSIRGGRYDLRPRTNIGLPSFSVGGIEYNFTGMTTTDALCIGPVIYSDYDTINDSPVISGPCYVSNDGWMTWELEETPSGTSMRHDSTCLFSAFTGVITGGGSDAVTVTVTPNVLTGGILPITGVKLNTRIVSTGGGYGNWYELFPHSGKEFPIYSVTGSAAQNVCWNTELTFSPKQDVASALGAASAGSGTINIVNHGIEAIRWPYGVPLAT